MKRLVLFVWAAALALGQTAPNVVISQVYGGGGNAGAPLRNDFIELFNRGRAPVDLSGWSVQYSSANGSDWQVTPIAGTIQPGRYFLVQQAAGANTAAPALPEPDATGAVAMSGTAAKVALSRTVVPLVITPFFDNDALVDLVAYGTTNFWEGASPAPALTNATAAIRRANGCTDTNNNAADFQDGTPRPRNSQTEAVTDCNASPVPPLPLRISEIQGPGAESPYTGRLVSTRGIVTSLKSNGFFLQSAPGDDDNDPQTSEGLFVFTANALPGAAQSGNLVEVIGTTTEFRPAADPGSPALTELTEPSVSLLATEQQIPSAVRLEDVGDWETVEGMSVSADLLRVAGPTGGSISESNATATTNHVYYGVLSSEVRPFTTSAGILGGRLLRVDSRAFAPSALDVASGAQIFGLSGPLDFGFRTYTINARNPPLGGSGDGPNQIIPRDPTQEFAVASMNMQRLFDDQNDPGVSDPVVNTQALQQRITRIAAAIRDTLQSPEIIGVIEVENLRVLQALAGAAGNYEAYLLEGNDPGGIDVGLLVRSDRVTVQSFAQEGKDTRIDGDVLNDRPPVILRATVDGLPVVIIVNHLRSLINADSPVVARKRRAQAEYLATLLSRERGENLISIGDYNMTQFDPLMQTIVSPGLLNLNSTLRPNEAYTYVFDGVTQALDHIVVSPPALRYLTRYQIAHFNADQPVTRRISDHDVPIAYFSAQPPALRASSVTNAANYTGGSLAPNEWVSIFTPGPITNVTAGGLPATIVSSTAQQTTVILPAELPSGVLTAGAASILLPTALAAPGIFTLSGTGSGQGAILNQDSTVNDEGKPAERGSIVSIYGTGLNPLLKTSVWIGTAEAEVLYSGPAPGLPSGVNQINARVPDSAPVGAEVPIVIASGYEASAAGTTLAIR